MIKHGLHKHQLYNTWINMKQRCCNERHPEFPRYGGRGIKICDQWLNEFEPFYKHMMSLPHAQQPGYSLDRIDNDGDYKPGNVRWGTLHQQNVNQRMKGHNTSGFTGVSYCKRTKKWRASIRVNGKITYFQRQKMIEESVKLRNDFIIANGLTEYKLQKV